jgi:hypothetical protein
VAATGSHIRIGSLLTTMNQMTAAATAAPASRVGHRHLFLADLMCSGLTSVEWEEIKLSARGLLRGVPMIEIPVMITAARARLDALNQRYADTGLAERDLDVSTNEIDCAIVYAHVEVDALRWRFELDGALVTSRVNVKDAESAKADTSAVLALTSAEYDRAIAAIYTAELSGEEVAECEEAASVAEKANLVALKADMDCDKALASAMLGKRRLEDEVAGSANFVTPTKLTRTMRCITRTWDGPTHAPAAPVRERTVMRPLGFGDGN